MPDSQVDTDALLVERAKNGDTQAFGELHDKYAEAIFRFLFARLANRMDAEDLTNDVFLRAWRALPGYQHKGIPFPHFCFVSLAICSPIIIAHPRGRSSSRSLMRGCCKARMGRQWI